MNGKDKGVDSRFRGSTGVKRDRPVSTRTNSGVTLNDQGGSSQVSRFS